jgi:hypothetical protein
VNLIDELLPAFDVRERHHTRVRASADAIYSAILATDFSENALVKALLFIRALPASIAAGRDGLRRLRNGHRAPFTLRTNEKRGFRIIAERPPREIVIGLEGRFWTMTGDLCTPAPADFRSTPPKPGTVRAVWNFTVHEGRQGEAAELATETRVWCPDPVARRRFLLYWFLIRAGSGLIRRMTLRDIRRAAELIESRTGASRTREG